jgi:hypothetical protein
LEGALDDFQKSLKQFTNAGKSVQQLKDNISKDFLEPLDSRLVPAPNFLKLHVTAQGRSYTLNYIGNTIAAALNTTQEVKLMCILGLFVKEISSLSFNV